MIFFKYVFNLHYLDLFDSNEYQLDCRGWGEIFFLWFMDLIYHFFKLLYPLLGLSKILCGNFTFHCSEVNHWIIVFFKYCFFFLLKAGSCPNLLNWNSYNKHCYIVVDGSGNQAKTWREAKKWCQNYGADLVSIGTMLEQLFVQSQAANTSSATLWTGFSEIDYDFGYRLVLLGWVQVDL